MKYFSTGKEAVKANQCFYEALKLARTYKGSSKELDTELQEKFNLCAVVRQELILLYQTRQELIRTLKSL